MAALKNNQVLVERAFWPATSAFVPTFFMLSSAPSRSHRQSTKCKEQKWEQRTEENS
jgi:hypothetical protein